MSRSGYVDDADDQWSMIRWRGAVASTIRGRTGQAFLRELLAALDAMPEKKLIAHELEQDGNVCAIGALGRVRGVDMSRLDPENYNAVAHAFGVNPKLVQELVYVNDEHWFWFTDDKGRILKDENGKDMKLTPEARWRKMRAWVEKKIRRDL